MVDAIHFDLLDASESLDAVRQAECAINTLHINLRHQPLNNATPVVNVFAVPLPIAQKITCTCLP